MHHVKCQPPAVVSHRISSYQLKPEAHVFTCLVVEKTPHFPVFGDRSHTYTFLFDVNSWATWERRGGAYCQQAKLTSFVTLNNKVKGEVPKLVKHATKTYFNIFDHTVNKIKSLM